MAFNYWSCSFINNRSSLHLHTTKPNTKPATNFSPSDFSHFMFFFHNRHGEWQHNSHMWVCPDVRNNENYELCSVAGNERSEPSERAWEVGWKMQLKATFEDDDDDVDGRRLKEREIIGQRPRASNLHDTHTHTQRNVMDQTRTFMTLYKRNNFFMPAPIMS
jgi:hypothetical protein